MLAIDSLPARAGQHPGPSSCSTVWLAWPWWPLSRRLGAGGGLACSSRCPQARKTVQSRCLIH